MAAEIEFSGRDMTLLDVYPTERSPCVLCAEGMPPDKSCLRLAYDKYGWHIDVCWACAADAVIDKVAAKGVTISGSGDQAISIGMTPPAGSAARPGG